MQISQSITPSEAVLIVEHFLAAEKDRPGFLRRLTFWSGSTTFRKHKTKVAQKQLALKMIKVAFLANEHLGAVNLQMQNNRSGINRLKVIRTENKEEWPPDTLENRIVPVRDAVLSNVVSDWIQAKSINPFKRVITLGKVMLTVRGFCNVRTSYWKKRVYTLNQEQLLVTADAIKVSKELLDNCKQNRPEIWHLLDQEITETINGLKKKKFTKGSEEDPWLIEADSDREKFADQLGRKTIEITGIIGAGLSCLVTGLLYGLMVLSRQYFFAAVTSVVVSIFVVLCSLRVKKLKNISLPLYISLNSNVTISILDKVTSTFVVIPLLTLVVLLIYLFLAAAAPLVPALLHRNIIDFAFNTESGRTVLRSLLFLLSLIGILIFNLLEEKTAKAITKKVINNEQKNEEEALHTIKPLVEDILTTDESLIEMETITAETLSPPPVECSERLNAVTLRRSSIRSLYRKGLFLFALSTLLLSILYKLIRNANEIKPMKDNDDFFLGVIPAFPIILFALTVALLLKPESTVAVVLRRVIGRLLMLGDYSPEFSTIRFVPLQIVETIWVIIAFQNILHYSSPPKTIEVLLIFITLSTIASFFLWMRKNRKLLEEKYPYRAPLNLLALRVFGSSSLSGFLALGKSWQWIGTTQRLDGPDTTGHKIGDVINYFSGRLDRSIVEDEFELQKAFKQFKTKPDSELKFAVNSMQCSNATWKKALQKLLDAADVIVVDLSGISEKNFGITYEIEKLFNEIPLQRIIFLLQDGTNMDVLKEMITHAYRNISADSPNKFPAIHKISFFNMAGLSKRYENETVYEWKIRQTKYVNETALVGLLYNAALPPRNPITIDPKKDAGSIRWTRFPMPEAARTIVYLVFSVYLLYILISIFIYFTLGHWLVFAFT